MLQAGVALAAVTATCQLLGQFSLLLTETLYYAKGYLHF